MYGAKEEPSHNPVFSYSYPHGSSAFHPVSPKVLKSSVSSDNQSPHEIWKTSSSESGWISSTVNMNSPIKLESSTSRSGNANDLHSTSHWSKTNAEAVSSPGAQSSSVHSFPFLIKPNSSQNQHGMFLF